MGTGSCTKSPAWEERGGHGREEHGGGGHGQEEQYFRNSQVMLITLEHNLILLNKSDTGDAHRIDRGAVLWLTKSKGRKWCKSNPVLYTDF